MLSTYAEVMVLPTAALVVVLVALIPCMQTTYSLTPTHLGTVDDIATSFGRRHWVADIDGVCSLLLGFCR